MGGQVVLLTDAYEPPTLRLVDCLHSAGVTALVEGLQEAEVIMSRERNPLARSPFGPGPLAVLVEVDAVMDAEELQVAARHATNVWPEVPLVACRRVAEECSISSLRPLDHPLLKRLGFQIIVDSPSQLPDVLRELRQIKDSQEAIKSESEDELSLGNLLLPSNLKKKELRAAFELVSSLHFASDQKSAALTALAGLATMILTDRWTIYLKTETDEDKYVIEPLAVRGVTKSEQAINEGWQRDITDEELKFIGKESKAAREAIEKGEIVRKHEKDKQVIAVPLISGDKVFGVLESVREGKDKRSFNRHETSLLNALVLPISASLANAVRIAEAERLSQTDDLTKLHNARFLRQCITNEIRKARRLGQNVSALFLDIDNFKKVNDVHGHLVGSHILLEMAGVLRTSVRTTDIVTRYGGDEFVVVLPDTNLENAAMIADRIREKLTTHIFTGGRGLNMKVTASFGVAVFPEHAASPQQLMAAADAAMYEAKAAQKDCIRFANVSLTIFSQQNTNPR